MKQTILHDLRASLRSVRRAPVLSMAIVLTAALGIGVNTAVFSVVDAVLLQPPPYPHGERLTQVWEATSGQRIPVSWTTFQNWRGQNHVFEEMAVFEGAEFTLTGRGDASLIHAGVVSSGFFHLTGWRPVAGRLFDEQDDRVGATPVVLVSSEFAARMLTSDPHSIGSALALDGMAYQIVGILPPGLRFFAQPVDVYVPVGPRNGTPLKRDEHGSMVALGLLRPGKELRSAEADLNAVMRPLGETGNELGREHRSSIAWLADFGTDDIRLTLFVLSGAVGLVLAIACANIAGLLLLRSTTRTREVAIRSAIGAPRRQLTRQLLMESVFIVVIGGLVGILLAGICLRSLLLAAPQDIPRLWESSVNLPVLTFAAALAIITGSLAGLAPVFELGSMDVSLALKEGSPGAGVGKRAQSLRSALIVMEVALTLVLTFDGGLLLQSLRAAQTHDPGFRADHVLAVELQLQPSTYKSDGVVRQFYDGLLRDLRGIPGVDSVGAVNCPPSTGGCARGWYSIEGMPAPERADVPLTLLTKVDAEYFQTIGMSLLAGRGFTGADRDGSRAVVINETIARRWWPERLQLAVGQRIKFGGPYMEGPTAQIVGVVGDVSQSALDVPSFSEVYVKATERQMVVMVRGQRDPARLIPAVRRELASLDRNVPAVSLLPFRVRMEGTLERRRFYTLLAEAIAGIAVALTSVGIYGFFNYWVKTRKKEIAIRIALGARRSAILRLTGQHIFRIAVLGITLGAFGCWATSRWLKSLVFGISEQNPWMLLMASSIVVAVAALAIIAPIWRATKVDPIRHLRDT